MNGTFNMKINLGNEAMSTQEDIVRMLESAISSLRFHGDLPKYHKKYLFDANGNNVGHWTVTTDKQIEKFVR